METRIVKDNDGYTYELEDSKIIAVSYGRSPGVHTIRIGDIVHTRYTPDYGNGKVVAIRFNMETVKVSDNIVEVDWPEFDFPFGSKIWEVETEPQRLEREALDRYYAASIAIHESSEQICQQVKARDTVHLKEMLQVLNEKLVDIASH
jgi:hypothetical protein